MDQIKRREGREEGLASDNLRRGGAMAKAWFSRQRSRFERLDALMNERKTQGAREA
jgi:hypothetical protein